MKNKYERLQTLFKRLEIGSYMCLLFSILLMVTNHDIKTLSVVIIFIIAIFIFNHISTKYSQKLVEQNKISNNNLNIDNEENSKEINHVENNEINIALLNIGIKNRVLFEENLAQKVVKYLKAINNQNTKEIKDICSKEIAERTIKSIEENDKLGYDLKIEEIEIINSTIIDVIPVKKNPIIDLKVIMTIKESVVKENKKNLNTKSDAKIYKVRFNKKEKNKKDYKCDNCGAELSAITDICPYCRTNTEFIEEQNWFITSIKEAI